MQNNLLSLSANYRPETLERILRVIRHRGFGLLALEMQTADNKIHLNMQVSSQRPLHLLVNQLVKLYDVEQVDVKTEKS
ncbi:acetolactate synthase small subunit [Mesocricetibacter intestinalis]|uniref:Acetolactate synthase small subunit n=1 Tax=Mesocricetibacter intestinalis TaxID=1521930 RepID=A0A4R6V6F7_9PAST|nr:acetolactate synthase 2 small subunit [Mesocricetibacter intestinalis]TDQ56624.1 acetolactate synthase small subunit [Mesocricetibacter intestinalis]